jgi:hypothetical protein
MFGGILIGSPEFYPAKTTRSVFIDVRHERIIAEGTRGAQWTLRNAWALEDTRNT